MQEQLASGVPRIREAGPGRGLCFVAELGFELKHGEKPLEGLKLEHDVVWLRS